ncbi:Hypothetical protein D9617_23g005330 [Elsinoe fawcettii]|nr:Hypothetical protein D9617_23g005330 [Elsinoe fawcettii]
MEEGRDGLQPSETGATEREALPGDYADSERRLAANSQPTANPPGPEPANAHTSRVDNHIKGDITMDNHQDRAPPPPTNEMVDVLRRLAHLETVACNSSILDSWFNY